MTKDAGGAEAGIGGCPLAEETTEDKVVGIEEKVLGKGPKLTWWFIGHKAQRWQHVEVADTEVFFQKPNGCKNDTHL